MIVVILLLILTGAISTSVILGLKGFSWGMIALGYVLGGWAGLAVGLPVLFLWRRIRCRRAARQAGRTAEDSP